ncbi:MAG TPA: Ran-binding zinc finger domain-containing protein [Thermoplasmata archaeon]|nr:Ran-binding zinc finger domain-containing protein [Thermoplasmata archaeon]
MRDDEDDERPKAPRRPRQPVAAVASTLVAAAAIIGYSGYWFSDALGVYLHCNPPPKNTICNDFSFWHFDPKFFLIAAIVGFVSGGLLTLLAFVLLFRPREHTMVGALILACSATSVLAYGGYYIGIAAGVAGGILAIVYRPPRFRELAQWSPRTPPRGSPTPAPPARAPANPTDPGSWRVPDTDVGPLSAEAYAPLPPTRRAYSPAPTAPAAAGPIRAPPRAPPVSPATPRYGNLSEALSGRAGAPGSASPPRSAPPRPQPPLPAPPAAAPKSSARPLTPYAVPTPRPTSPPPASRTTATPPPPPAPVVLPRAMKEGDVPAPAAGPRARSWKCPQCGLTNAPWSTSCTRCHTAAPQV